MAGRTIHIEEDIVNLPIERVWSLASSFGALKTWMPGVKWVTIEGDGVGAIRTVMLGSGPVREQLEVSDHKNYTILYRMLDPIPLPAKKAYGAWKMESLGEDKTKITWTAGAEEVDDESVAFIKPIYQGFLKESLASFVKVLL